MEYSPEVDQRTATSPGDKVGTLLGRVSEYLFLVPLGILPVLFIPGVPVSFDYTKLLPVIIATLFALVFFSLATLRSGTITVPKGYVLPVFWAIVLFAVLSALLSGDVYDALINDTLRVHSALFIVFMATVMSLVTLVGNSKLFVMRLYVLLTGSALLLGVFHITRLVLGPEVLQFGVFGSATNSLLGNWNDVALFYGLCIIVSLVVLEQLPLTKWGRSLFIAVTAIALIMLAVVNFFAVWLVLGVVSLLVLMYSLVKDRLNVQPSFTSHNESTASLTSIATSTIVFIVSMVFIVGGSFAGSFVNNLTNVSFVEVRPSVLATIDIGQATYADNALFGVGPNRFVDAWRENSDQSLNQTIFWNTQFSSGSGFILTQMVTNGALTVIAWVVFLGLFIFTGIRTLATTTSRDKVWYFIATSSFVAATYLWLMALLYNPGAAILVLTALLTGISITAGAVMRSSYFEVLSVSKNRTSAFVLIGIVMVTIVGSSLLLYGTARHYAAVYTYAQALQLETSAQNLEQVEATVERAIGIIESDTFYNRFAQYQLLKMESLLGVTEPTAEQQQQFEASTANGITAAQRAVAIDGTEPRNWVTLARMYAVLSLVGVEGAGDRAAEAYGRAKTLSPNNPAYVLAEAQYLAQSGDLEGARTKIDEAIALKSNYTQALFLLTQLEAESGNTAEAVQAAQSMVALEPRNAARLYQLGILQSANENLEGAIASFERAVQIDTNFANARYFLALGYLEQGRTDDAVAQLQRVQELNPDNEQITALITQIESGDVVTTPESTENEPVAESSPVTTEDDVVTTTEEPDTNLIVPINTVPSTEEEESE